MNLNKLESDYKELEVFVDKVRNGEELNEDELYKISDILDCPNEFIEDCYKERDFEQFICRELDDIYHQICAFKKGEIKERQRIKEEVMKEMNNLKVRLILTLNTNSECKCTRMTDKYGNITELIIKDEIKELNKIFEGKQ